MGHQSLAEYFKVNFGMIQHHHWSLTEIENMLPWERYVYVEMLSDFIKAEEERIKDLQMQQKAFARPPRASMTRVG